MNGWLAKRNIDERALIYCEGQASMPVEKITIPGGTSFTAYTGYAGDIRSLYKSDYFYRLRVSIFEHFAQADFAKFIVSFDVINTDLRIQATSRAELEVQPNDPVTAVFDIDNAFSKEKMGLVVFYNHRNRLWGSNYLLHAEAEKGNLGKLYGCREAFQFWVGMAVTFFTIVAFIFLLSLLPGKVYDRVGIVIMMIGIISVVCIGYIGYQLTFRQKGNSSRPFLTA